MTINIKDWSHNDQRQYFEGAYVIFEMNGATRAGRIDRVMDGHCVIDHQQRMTCLLYTSPSPRDKRQSRMPSSA